MENENNLEDTLYAIVREDFNNIKYVVFGRLTKSEAEKRLKEFIGKSHHQDYWVVTYTTSQREEKFQGYRENHLA